MKQSREWKDIANIYVSIHNKRDAAILENEKGSKAHAGGNRCFSFDDACYLFDVRLVQAIIIIAPITNESTQQDFLFNSPKNATSQ